MDGRQEHGKAAKDYSERCHDAALASYEDVNGPVPSGPSVDAEGLAQQVSSSPSSATIVIDTDTTVGASKAQHDPTTTSLSLSQCPDANVFDLDLLPSAMANSNIGPVTNAFMGHDSFFQNAKNMEAERRAAGYAADGSNGGMYSASSPPPGMEFAGYRKGCTAINWRQVN